VVAENETATRDFDLAQAPRHTVSGHVRDGAGAALPNARVEIVIDGVPASLATVAADGTFSALGFYAAGKPVDITVTPPAGSPLPSLHGSATTWNLGAPVTINFDAKHGGTLVIRYTSLEELEGILGHLR